MSQKQLLQNEQEWGVLISAGQVACSAKHYAQAIAFLEEARDLAIEKKLPPARLLYTLTYYGAALHESGDRARAEAVFAEAIDYSTKHGCSRTQEHRNLFAELGMLKFESAHLDAGILFLEKYLDMHRKAKAKVDDYFLLAHLSLALIFQVRRNWDRFAAHSRTAYDALIKTFGTSHAIAPEIIQLNQLAQNQNAMAKALAGSGHEGTKH